MAHRDIQPQKKYQVLLCLLFLTTLQLLSTQTLNLSQYLPTFNDVDYYPIVARFTHATVFNNATLSQLSQLEDEVTKLHNQKATSCRTPRGQYLCQDNNTNLVWYNPSNRDKFICNELLVGPGKTITNNKDSRRSSCWTWKHSLTSHSFPMAATVQNKGLFPG
jgi:hypothetical protein